MSLKNKSMLMAIVLLIATAVLILNKPNNNMVRLATDYSYLQTFDIIKSLSVDSFAVIASGSHEKQDTAHSDTALLRQVKEFLFTLNKQTIGYKYSYLNLGIYVVVYKGTKGYSTSQDFVLLDTMLIKKIDEAFKVSNTAQ